MDGLTTRLAWFKAVILPHEGALRSRLRRACPPGFDVDNLVAESLARAYAAKDIDRIPTGRGYLFTIARNLLIDTLRRETIVSLDFVADLDTLRSDDTLEASLTARDELRRLHAIIETLPAQCRQVFILRRVHDVSFQEIAVRMSLSVSTVEKHLARAVMLVAKAMSEREEGSFDRITRRGRKAADRREGLGAPR
ncbi:sigma-70 family RNA polymerase sigma factor [Caulobacter sp.]|jgi:RNA polymerase sigma factor (sigma-70 family)|uniref:sigma-70 family RNA polymerase sigma factor n=1 Tax=Caulobacter sp. TaxID=78 RepID=UPI00161B0CDB